MSDRDFRCVAGSQGIQPSVHVRDEFDDLLDASSLGSPAAQRIRSLVPDAVVEQARDRAEVQRAAQHMFDLDDLVLMLVGMCGDARPPAPWPVALSEFEVFISNNGGRRLESFQRRPGAARESCSFGRQVLNPLTALPVLPLTAALSPELRTLMPLITRPKGAARVLQYLVDQGIVAEVRLDVARAIAAAALSSTVNAPPVLMRACAMVFDKVLDKDHHFDSVTMFNPAVQAPAHPDSEADPSPSTVGDNVRTIQQSTRCSTTGRTYKLVSRSPRYKDSVWQGVKDLIEQMPALTDPEPRQARILIAGGYGLGKSTLLPALLRSNARQAQRDYVVEEPRYWLDAMDPDAALCLRCQSVEHDRADLFDRCGTAGITTASMVAFADRWSSCDCVSDMLSLLGNLDELTCAVRVSEIHIKHPSWICRKRDVEHRLSRVIVTAHRSSHSWATAHRAVRSWRLHFEIGVTSSL
ncbi:hypothetical protein ACOZ38_28365 [Sphaerisporangium viridialbum]|uniref:hypothetical protein n=1 Tax=Sphaerisporangium viridialbum TaxID=46189 RepID=UPI003C733F13